MSIQVNRQREMKRYEQGIPITSESNDSYVLANDCTTSVCALRSPPVNSFLATLSDNANSK
jgi:hypothetical protein